MLSTKVFLEKANRIATVEAFCFKMEDSLVEAFPELAALGSREQCECGEPECFLWKKSQAVWDTGNRLPFLPGMPATVELDRVEKFIHDSREKAEWPQATSERLITWARRNSKKPSEKIEA